MGGVEGPRGSTGPEDMRALLTEKYVSIDRATEMVTMALSTSAVTTAVLADYAARKAVRAAWLSSAVWALFALVVMAVTLWAS